MDTEFLQEVGTCNAKPCSGRRFLRQSRSFHYSNGYHAGGLGKGFYFQLDFRMSSLVITNIKQLVNVRNDSHLLRGKELEDLPCIENAYLIIEEGVIADFGEMNKIQNLKSKFQ